MITDFSKKNGCCLRNKDKIALEVTQVAVRFFSASLRKEMKNNLSLLSLVCTSLKSRMLLGIHASEMEKFGLCDVPGHLDEHDIESKMI